MKRFLAILGLLLLSASACFALSDAEYLRMKKNSADFARADKRLNQAWAKLKKSLPKNVFTELDKLQKEWVKSGRDSEAEQLMSDGYSRVEAYTMATSDRADELPKIADSLRKGKAKPAQPKQTKKPAEDDGLESQPLSDPAGDYESNNCFMNVKILDYSSMEARVSFGRWKDEVSWEASGWIDDGILELSDANCSECQATIYFEPHRAKVIPSESEDWAKVTAEDFDLRGTYTKKQ